jgi:type III secretion protein Q
MDDVASTNASETESSPNGSAAGKPDLSSLPIRLQVILSQIELSLDDLGRLMTGSIIELDRGKSDSVHLAANGRVIGSGDLVELEGKLGVRIIEWSAS